MSHLIPIGNSLGIRIPKAMITQLEFKKDTELQLKITSEGLLIQPLSHARKNWAKIFKGRKKSLLMGEKMESDFDKDEWEW